MRKKILNTSLLTSLLASIYGVAYANPIAELREYNETLVRAERQYLQDNQQFFVLNADYPRQTLAQSQYAFLLDTLVRPGISRRMDELFSDSTLVNHVKSDPDNLRVSFSPLNISGDATNELVVHARITTPDGISEPLFYILKQQNGIWNVVYAQWGLDWSRLKILFLDSPSGEHEHIAFQDSSNRLHSIATYVPELQYFMTQDDREAFIQRAATEMVATEAKAMVSDRVVWMLDSPEHTLKTFSEVRQDATALFMGARKEYAFGEVEDLIGLYNNSGVKYASETLYSHPAFLGGSSLEPFKLTDVLITLTSFNDFGDNDDFMPMRGRLLTFENKPDIAVPAEMINFSGGKAYGTIKVTEQTPVRFGFSYDATTECSVAFSINGREVIPHLDQKMRSFEETLVRTFPVGEFPYELDLTCDVKDDTFVGSDRFTRMDIILQTEDEINLPTYQYDWKNALARRSPRLLNIKPVAVEVETSTEASSSTHLELLDFSMPVVLRDLTEEQKERIIPEGYTEKVVRFEFTPTEVGVHEFNVRSLSNICAGTSANACIIQYRNTFMGFVGYQLLHPASRIQVGDKRSVSAGTFYASDNGYASTFTHRPVLNHVLSVRVTEDMVGKALPVEIQLNVDMTKALVLNNNVMMADVFGDLNEANHHSVVGQVATSNVVQEENKMLRDGLVARMDFTIGIRTPTDVAMRPLTDRDVSSHRANARQAVPVIYERPVPARLDDDTSWID